MAMMVREKRLALVAKMESREGKNTYTQSTRRSRVDSGYSDCSSLVHWVYKEVLGINIGDDTVGQIRTKKLTTIDAGIRDGIPDEKKLLPGDLLFFRGSDTGRKAADYVGHVEMYVGNGELSGHGFGIGPVRKNMAEYCRARRERSAPAPINNRGLICVRRALPADTSDYAASSASPEGKASSVSPEERNSSGVSWKVKLEELYVTALGRLPDPEGLAFWEQQLKNGKSWEEISDAVIDSSEGRKRYVRELYTFLLGREPDAAEMEAWLNVLEHGGTRAEVFRGFLESEEYHR
ncbi:DUF4214 domain-containing protein [Hominifimenecus microfluidus]|uniref:DUF4214 domain-containing protein n=1 Tax=Hominifimenecus microfluidus TaxID=2885348 RepID=UPI0032BFC741